MLGLYVRSLARGTSCVIGLHSGPYTCNKHLHSNVRLTATPRVALNDVIPRIRVEGLEPKTPITLRAELFDDRGKRLLANAHYVSDEGGVVEVMKDASLGGTYSGVFPTGLLSTLKIADGSFEYGRVYQEDIRTPLQIKLNVYEGHESLTTKKDALDSVNLQRFCVAPGVRRIPIKEGKVRGVLFLPPGEGPHPAVIDMYGTIGLAIECRSAMAASHGIASLCLPYFNYDDIPANKLLSLDLEYFEEAVEIILSQPGVIKDRCGVLGSCVGGLIGHYMMFYLEKVQALFAINFPMRPLGYFTYKGQKIGGDLMKTGMLLEPLHGDICTPIAEFKKGMNVIDENFINAMKTVISVEKKHFVYAIGEDDCYGFMNWLKSFKDQFSDYENDGNLTIKTYPNAGHIIDALYNRAVTVSFMRMPFAVSSDTIDFQNVVQTWGGHDRGNILMQEGVWADVFPFFNYHLRDQSSWYQQWLKNKEIK